VGAPGATSSTKNEDIAIKGDLTKKKFFFRHKIHKNLTISPDFRKISHFFSQQIFFLFNTILFFYLLLKKEIDFSWQIG